MTEIAPGENRFRIGGGLFWLAALLVAAVTAVGVWWWYSHGPGYTDHPVVQHSKALMNTARKRPLSAAEFDEALGLLKSSNAIAQIMAIATIQLEAGRTPEYRDRAIAELQQCGQTADPMVAQAARTAADRLEAKPKGP